MPTGYLRCSHGWLKNVAFMTPVSSATVASTSGFMPRRRTGRLVIERTSTTTVALSPALSVATVRASRRSRGRCSSRSPTVRRPSCSAASAAFCGETFSASGERRRAHPAQRRAEQGRAVELVCCRRRRWPRVHDDRPRGPLRGGAVSGRRSSPPMTGLEGWGPGSRRLRGLSIDEEGGSAGACGCFRRGRGPIRRPGRPQRSPAGLQQLRWTYGRFWAHP